MGHRRPRAAALSSRASGDGAVAMRTVSTEPDVNVAAERAMTAAASEIMQLKSTVVALRDTLERAAAEQRALAGDQDEVRQLRATIAARSLLPASRSASRTRMRT